MKYWEIEFECDNSWSISGIYAFYMRQETKPTTEDIKSVHGVYPNYNGLGDIVRIIDITDDLEHYEGIPNEWCFTHFADDEEKMEDFRILTKEEFLLSYSYLTEEEYDMTAEYCKNNK